MTRCDEGSVKSAMLFEGFVLESKPSIKSREIRRPALASSEATCFFL